MDANTGTALQCPGCLAYSQTDGPVEEVKTLIPMDTIERLIQRTVLTTQIGRRFINLSILKAHFFPFFVFVCGSFLFVGDVPWLLTSTH